MVNALPTSDDLLELTAALVAIPSVSHHEAAIVEVLEAELRAHDHLTVDRVGDNLVARTDLGRRQRVVLAGHTDTVPPSGNASVDVRGDVLHGVGAADMKGGLALMVHLARTLAAPALDVTYVFYAREEIAAVHSGLQELIDARADLLAGDIAILGEPTDGVIEAGCQGTLRLMVTIHGERAHTARPWTGRNAVHRLGALLITLAQYEGRRPVLAGCEFREALQAVEVTGGIAGNVVPDVATLTVNHRFAPDRSAQEAEQHVRDILAPHLEPGDDVVLTDVAAGAAPGMDHPLLEALVQRNGLQVRAKLGWTDVARFATLGIPAVNLGPGDPLLAHTAAEHLARAPLDQVHSAIAGLLRDGS